MKLSFIGTYPPRQCGIATFTKNLVQSMTNGEGQGSDNGEELIIALSDHEQSYAYHDEVKLVIRQEQQVDYIKAANFINLSGADLCILQHEFGIFGGQNGVYILPLIHRLKIPLIVTLHTVLEKPS